MNKHEDLELIAAFREGLLEPGRVVTGSTGHLSGCAVCAQRQAALDEVTAAIERAAPAPLPPSLAQRLDAALAAEVAAARAAAADASGSAAVSGQGEHSTRSEHSAGHGVAAGHSRVPAPHARRRPAGRAPAGRAPDASRPGGRGRPGGRLMAVAMRPLTAAAAVCLLAGGGYLLANSLTHPAPGTSASGPSRTQGRQIRSGGVAAHAAMVAPQLRIGASAVVRSGTSYRSGQLAAQAAAVASENADHDRVARQGRRNHTCTVRDQFRARRLRTAGRGRPARADRRHGLLRRPPGYGDHRFRGRRRRRGPRVGRGQQMLGLRPQNPRPAASILTPLPAPPFWPFPGINGP